MQRRDSYGDKLPQSDELPHLICRPCERRLNMAIQFKRTISETQRLLRQDVRTKRVVELSLSVVEPASKLQQTGLSSRRSLDFNVATGNQSEGAQEYENYSTFVLQVSMFFLCVLAEYSALLMTWLKIWIMHSCTCIDKFYINSGFIQESRFCYKKTKLLCMAVLLNSKESLIIFFFKDCSNTGEDKETRWCCQKEWTVCVKTKVLSWSICWKLDVRGVGGAATRWPLTANILSGLLEHHIHPEKKHATTYWNYGIMMFLRCH